MKSGNPNFLEPSGPLQACNGTALPFSWTNKGLKTINMHVATTKINTELTRGDNEKKYENQNKIACP